MGGLHPAMQTPVAPPGASRPQEPAYGSAAAQLYSKGDAAGLAALAKAARDPDERLALEWASLRSDAHLSVAALAAFAEAHPGWPDGGWIRRRREGQLLVNPEAPAKVAAYFASEPPQSSAGMIAAARAANATGRSDEGVAIIRALWRDGDFDFSAETLILREFGAALTRADHKYRADRLLYAESFAAALRAAALAGPDISALARARITAARGPLTPALAMAVPPPLRNDPGLLFARIRPSATSSHSLAPNPPDHHFRPNSARSGGNSRSRPLRRQALQSEGSARRSERYDAQSLGQIDRNALETSPPPAPLSF